MKEFEDLIEITEMAFEYIDALPKELELPSMPGFDRDEADAILENAKSIIKNLGEVSPETEPPHPMLSDVRKIANNTLYFADNSDYRSALFNILNIVTPGGILNEDGDLKERLKYIDD